ncbi:MAG: hypothetical protein KGI54_05815 [Pseudomonadota bacterium]|nr:hypothetical protein [Pseudomonadota bacterium]
MQHIISIKGMLYLWAAIVLTFALAVLPFLFPVYALAAWGIWKWKRRSVKVQSKVTSKVAANDNHSSNILYPLGHGAALSLQPVAGKKVIRKIILSKNQQILLEPMHGKFEEIQRKSMVEARLYMERHSSVNYLNA